MSSKIQSVLLTAAFAPCLSLLSTIAEAQNPPGPPPGPPPGAVCEQPAGGQAPGGQPGRGRPGGGQTGGGQTGGGQPGGGQADGGQRGGGQPGGGQRPCVPPQQSPADSAELVALGRQLFFDTNLSSPAGLSCASCHDPAAGFADPDDHLPTSEGIIGGRFGSRNSPTASYAAFVPPLFFDRGRRGFTGGLFLDGRVDSLAEQAKRPFLGALEMNNPDAATVIESVRNAFYAQDFLDVFGTDALDTTDAAYDHLANAIAAFERSDEVSPFNSKHDAVQAGEETRTPAEQRGARLFFGRAQCVVCHRSNNGRGRNEREVFSDFSYANIGVPANPGNPFYTVGPAFNPAGFDFIDNGLGAVVDIPRENGKFRVPTLRNVQETAPYMHNGVFQTLEEVVHFYNVRDVEATFAPPEVAENVTRRGGVGDLGLTAEEEADLISFLLTLSDR